MEDFFNMIKPFLAIFVIVLGIIILYKIGNYTPNVTIVQECPKVENYDN